MRYDAVNTLIFGLSPYLFFGLLGFWFAFVLYTALLCRFMVSVKVGNLAAVLSLPALAAGAKLFGMVLNVTEALAVKAPITADTFLKSGIVYYGGLCGFLICFKLLIRKQLMKKIYADAAAVVIPLFHAFGRVGCFTAGCCYGIVTDGWLKVLYTAEIGGTVSTDWRVPIQLIESGEELVLFVVLLVLLLRGKAVGQLTDRYLALYALLRFINEFFRADTAKPLCGLSLAQGFSIFVFLYAVWKLYFSRKHSAGQENLIVPL